MSNPKKWLRLATKLAHDSTPAGFGKRASRHGAVVVRGGRIIGVGVNSTRGVSSVDQSENSWRGSYLHAEEVAIKMAGSRASGATLYVSRVNKNGEARLSEPCIRCDGVISRSGVRRVVYTESK